MCCGSKRAGLRAGIDSTRAVRAKPAIAVAAPSPLVLADLAPTGPGIAVTKIRYEGNAPIRLRGPITGRAYSFSDAYPVQEVDVRDAAILLRNLRYRLSTP